MREVLVQRAIHCVLQTIFFLKIANMTLKSFATFVELQRFFNQNETVHPNDHSFLNVIPFKTCFKNLSRHFKSYF